MSDINGRPPITATRQERLALLIPGAGAKRSGSEYLVWLAALDQFVPENKRGYSARLYLLILKPDIVYALEVSRIIRSKQRFSRVQARSYRQVGENGAVWRIPPV